MPKQEGQSKTWWQGNSTRVWRVLLIAYISTLSFFGAWMFNRTCEIVPRAEFYTVMERFENKIDKINDNLLQVIRDGPRNSKG